jgi:hypothetical protein
VALWDRWVLAQTRQEACDRLETAVMRPSGTRENKQTNTSWAALRCLVIKLFATVFLVDLSLSAHFHMKIILLTNR